MTGLKWIIVFALAGYGALLALLYLAQRSLMYFPDTRRVAPADADFAGAEEIVLTTADGERVIAWHVKPKGARPVILYFHGNGASLRYRVDRFRALVATGAGLLALSYRGYGGSTGAPSERGFMADAAALYDYAAAHYPGARLVLWGESIGGGVAVPLAAEKKVAALVLEAPFSSAVDVAAGSMPIVPVRLLMKDQFRSDLKIAQVTAPILILHGARDRVVPIALGEKLYALANEPKRFVRLAQAGHEDLADFGAIETALRFIDETIR